MMKRPCLGILLAVFFAVLSGLLPSGAMATDGAVKLSAKAPQKINLIVGKSLVIEIPYSAKRVSLAAPAFADAMVLTPRQIYLTGKSPGMTNLTVWEGDAIAAAYDVEVAPDVVRLKEVLHEILPQETNIRVSALHDTITLSGTVSTTANLSQALAVAAPFGKVANLLEVGGVQQVMLEVRVSEMQKSVMRRLGFNFSYISADGSKIGLSLLNKLTSLPKDKAFPEIRWRSPTRSTPYTLSRTTVPPGPVLWTPLKANGLLTILAEPTLTTLSGQTASFNAGGELPIPEASGLGTVSITYKKFGVGLSFTPTVLSDGKISLQVSPRVSDLDFSNAIVSSGFLIPAFTEREVSTVVELGDGQSFAIAGLLNENVTENVSKFPLLGDIPILGALFRSTSFKKNETELVVIVTPHLVKPLDMRKQSLPTDKFSDPGDFKFYLMGILSGSPKEAALDGEVGHVMR